MKPKQILVKTISWRIIACLITFLCAVIITPLSNIVVGTALGIALADSFVKFFTYYYHEKLWLKILKGDTMNRTYWASVNSEDFFISNGEFEITPEFNTWGYFKTKEEAINRTQRYVPGSYTIFSFSIDESNIDYFVSGFFSSLYGDRGNAVVKLNDYFEVIVD